MDVMNAVHHSTDLREGNQITRPLYETLLSRY